MGEPTAILPRLLLWETADERVIAVAADPGASFRAVAIEGRQGSEFVAGTITAEQVVTAWSAAHPDVVVPSTDVEIAAAAVGLRLVDGAVGGVDTTSAAVLRAGLRYVGAAGTVSIAMLADPPQGSVLGRRIMLADCAVVRHPSAAQLADIAIASAESWERVTATPARVAFVAATTKAADDSDDARKITRALALVSARCPDLWAEGELQVDAALTPEIANRKLAVDAVDVKARRVAANVLVFPNLVAANAAYKLLQHLGGYGITPITQHMRRPFFDISRGCSPEEFRAAALQCASLAASAASELEVTR